MSSRFRFESFSSYAAPPCCGLFPRSPFLARRAKPSQLFGALGEQHACARLVFLLFRLHRSFSAPFQPLPPAPRVPAFRPSSAPPSHSSSSPYPFKFLPMTWLAFFFSATVGVLCLLCPLRRTKVTFRPSFPAPPQQEDQSSPFFLSSPRPSTLFTSVRRLVVSRRLPSGSELREGWLLLAWLPPSQVFSTRSPFSACTHFFGIRV